MYHFLQIQEITLRIQVPIQYAASGRRAGNRINSSLRFRELIDIDLKTTDEDDAPIVAAWNDTPPPSLLDAKEWGPSHGDFEHVRHHADAFWRPLRRYETHPALAPAKTSTFEEARAFTRKANEYALMVDISHVGLGEFVERSRGGEVLGVLPDQGKNAGRKMESATDYFDLIEFSHQDSATKPMIAAFNDLLVVDEKMYVRCIEPCLAVFTTYHQIVVNGYPCQEIGMSLRVINRSEKFNELASSALFPITNIKDAIHQARRYNASKRTVKDELNGNNLIRAPNSMSEYFTDPDNAQVCEGGLRIRQFLSLIEKEWGNLMGDTQKLRLLCDITDAERAYPADWAIEAIEQAAEAWLAAYSEERRQSASGATGALQSAFEALSQRPIASLNIDLGALRKF
jgi:hypothetical protein